MSTTFNRYDWKLAETSHPLNTVACTHCSFKGIGRGEKDCREFGNAILHVGKKTPIDNNVGSLAGWKGSCCRCGVEAVLHTTTGRMKVFSQCSEGQHISFSLSEFSVSIA